MLIVAVHQEPGSTLDSLEPPIHERGHELVHWNAWIDPEPIELAEADAVIVLGGKANPDQTGELPWLAHERDVLAELVAGGTPVLGICLGAQLLASSIGAPVHRLPLPEIGWYPISTTPAALVDPVLSALPERFPAFEWHDYAFDLPPGATLLAGSPRSPHQAVRLTPNAWALQFHLEVGPETIASWTLDGEHELEARGFTRAQVIADTLDEAPAYVRLAHDVAHRFLDVAESNAAAR
ncbi:MAG: type 1 glutamine amidotransferase [Gaiellales bacterium]